MFLFKIVGEAIQAFGRIDVLVSNAGSYTRGFVVDIDLHPRSNPGICPFSDFLEMDIEVWHRTRNVNLDGAFYITQAVARQMKEQVPQGGSIIGISSISALVGGGQQVYVHACSPLSDLSLMLHQSLHTDKGGYSLAHAEHGRRIGTVWDPG